VTVEVLIEKAAPETVARVGEQRIDRSSLGRGVESVNAFLGGEVVLDGLSRNTELTKGLRCMVDCRLIGGDQQVKAVFGAAFGKFVTDAARSAGDNCEWTSI